MLELEKGSEPVGSHAIGSNTVRKMISQSWYGWKSAVKKRIKKLEKFEF
jgi:hypothetical protein